jgi:hypothetical protein
LYPQEQRAFIPISATPRGGFAYFLAKEISFPILKLNSPRLHKTEPIQWPRAYCIKGGIPSDQLLDVDFQSLGQLPQGGELRVAPNLWFVKGARTILLASIAIILAWIFSLGAIVQRSQQSRKTS